jgi:hypothetical protein
MSTRYIPPEHGKGGFTCPHCNVLTGQTWHAAQQFKGATELGLQWTVCQSEDCGEVGLWVGDWVGGWPSKSSTSQLIYPIAAVGSPPNDDLSDDVRKDFQEARGIANRSPRGAAALLRLALQKLCAELGYNQHHLNDAIDALIKEEVLPKVLQQSLHAVRVIGNESVHPGQMDIRDDRDTAMALFDLVNLIAERLISEPKAAKAIYASLPESKKDKDLDD